MHVLSTLAGTLSLLAATAAAQKPYRLANCYSFSSAIYPLDLQAIYADNTLESCANNCSVFGFTFFGVSDGTNCYCGNSVYDDLTSSQCFGPDSDPCPGAPDSERCGGNNQMAIYGDPALIGDCPSTPLAGLGAPCATVLAGAAPSGVSSSSSSIAPSTADRSGASQTPTPSATATDTSSSSAAASTSYISTTDASGSPTLIPTISQASRTGIQNPSSSDGPAATDSPTGTGSPNACSPATLRSALVDSRGRTVSVFPAEPASATLMPSSY